MKQILKLTLGILLSISLFSCSSDETIDNSKLDLSKLKSLNEFEQQFPTEYSKLETGNMQDREGYIIKSLEKFNSQDYFTMPILENNIVVGRIFSNKGDVQYLDLKNYKKEITISYFSKEKNNLTATFPMIYDKKIEAYIVDNSYSQKISWCEWSCYLGVAAMAISDGPAPIMDIIAIAYGVTCIEGCNE